MPEFFLELFSEEIPARMQRDAGTQLEKICSAALASLKISVVEVFTGPRRIALKAILNAQSETRQIEERGPRDTAPEAALAGFLGKHKASRADVVAEGGYFLLRRSEPAITAPSLILSALPTALAKFPWPKSMRWGQSGAFTWVRPLRRMICLLDEQIIPITVGPITAGNVTEGHRFLSPDAFVVSSATDWQTKLRDHRVIADQTERRALIFAGLTKNAAAQNLTLADDPGLIDEVTGLVEWPVALTGRIDDDYMNLPPEVRELSMKVNQRYFALRDAAGGPAPHFAFVSNIEAEDGGAAIVAGNERVLRARLSDAQHFWELDVKVPLSHHLSKLHNVTFHAELGSQEDRANRLAVIAGKIAAALGGSVNEVELATNAGALAKADLATGMVGEFPELQGIIGGYYAALRPNRWDGAVLSEAIRTQYLPKGPNDDVPHGIVPCAVALADKIDTLNMFFSIGEKPTGSGDPYALRRAALGVIRIILENRWHLNLTDFDASDQVIGFIIERLRVKLRNDGQRFDILNAILAVDKHDNLTRIMDKVAAISFFLESLDGSNLLAAYKRAVNILRIENVKDGPHLGHNLDSSALTIEDENFRRALSENPATFALRIGDFHPYLNWLAKLRVPVDEFFEIAINDPDPRIRCNRLALLAQLRDAMHQIADFSKIEG